MLESGATEQPEREVSDQEKALAKDWLKRIDAALNDPARKEAEKLWKTNRNLLRGRDGDKKMRTNLHFANLAAMRPQVYAKDPEFAVSPTKAVPEAQIDLVRGFAETAEQVVTELLVRRAKLKKRAKRLLTSAYACSIGYLKVCFQEDRQRDPIIVNQIKDAQDNLERLRSLQEEVDEHEQGNELEVAKLEETIKGLQAQPELVISRGITVDFVAPDDHLVLDASIREVTDGERSEAQAHRVWMTRCQYKQRFGCDAKKARVYREGARGDSDRSGPQATSGAGDKEKDLLAVWEVWEQASGRVFTLCEGEEGFCRDTYSPTWTGKRWYPFFLLAFNEIDGQFYPLSDVELTTEVVREYNKARDDWERDRRDALPFTVARKGGTLTEEDLRAIRNREGNNVVVIEGPGGRALSDDIQAVSLGALNPANYDTTPSRQDMEMLVGGGDAARGSVLKAKTATEAEILAQGMRGRSAERTDIIEDLLTEIGEYVLEVCLRKLTKEDVQKIAGPEAVWPQLKPEQIFEMVTLTVRGGSTGKPDRLQEQDRWTKLLPVIEKAMAQVAKLREAGMQAEAEAVVQLVRETLRRFDERVDIERFLPAPKDGEQPGQQIPPQLVQQFKDMQQKLQEAEQALQDKTADRQADVQKAQINADAKVQASRDAAIIGADSRLDVALVGQGQPAPMMPLPMIPGTDAPGVDGSPMHEGMEGPAEATEAASPWDVGSPDDAQRAVASMAPRQRAPRGPKAAAAPAQDGQVLTMLIPLLMQMQQQLSALAMRPTQQHAQPDHNTPMEVVHERDPITKRIVRSVRRPVQQ